MRKCYTLFYSSIITLIRIQRIHVIFIHLFFLFIYFFLCSFNSSFSSSKFTFKFTFIFIMKFSSLICITYTTTWMRTVTICTIFIFMRIIIRIKLHNTSYGIRYIFIIIPRYSRIIIFTHRNIRSGISRIYTRKTSLWIKHFIILITSFITTRISIHETSTIFNIISP